MAGIELRNLSKRYGVHTAIEPLDLSIVDGEFCVFVGPSGCGKSTLLRTIAGLEDLSGGQVFIDGEDVSQRHPGARGAAMVFQNYALYPHMTVRQNISYALKLAGDSKAEIARKVDEAAAILGLGDLLERKPAQLSGGQRQRVAIGRAIVRDPKVFLFDEPLSNLDAELRTRMRLELTDLHDRLDATMIYVTHDQVEAMTLADRIVVMRSGRIEQVGTPYELYDTPANLFVARFIGSPSMNFLTARGDPGRVSLPQLDNLDIAVPGFSGHDELLLGIRPEHFEFVQEPEAGAAIRLRSVEHLGGASYGYARLPQADAGTDFCIDLKGRRDLSAGDAIRITIPTERAFLFDPKTELRLH